MTNQQQTLPVSAYPYPSNTAGVNGGTYGQPPPAGYPMSYDDQTPTTAPVPADTQTRGDGFWKGCCAALCCCCVLDACF